MGKVRQSRWTGARSNDLSHPNREGKRKGMQVPSSPCPSTSSSGHGVGGGGWGWGCGGVCAPLRICLFPPSVLSEALLQTHPKTYLGLLGDSKPCKSDNGHEAPQTGHGGLLQNVTQFQILKVPSKSVILRLFVSFSQLGKMKHMASVRKSRAVSSILVISIL